MKKERKTSQESFCLTKEAIKRDRLCMAFSSNLSASAQQYLNLYAKSRPPYSISNSTLL